MRAPPLPPDGTHPAYLTNLGGNAYIQYDRGEARRHVSDG